MTDHVRLNKIKNLTAVSKIDCEFNNLTKEKQYQVIEVFHEEEGDNLVYIDDNGNENVVSADLFDITCKGEKI